jgi:3-oxoadipate CoA-transferase alpha subunit
MISKVVASAREAVADVADGSTLMVGGFGSSGFPDALVEALADRGVGDLAVVHNGAGLGRLISDRRVRKLTCSYPIGASSKLLAQDLEAGATELEVIPQGTLVERIRAGGAGLGGVLTPTGVDIDGGRSPTDQVVDVDGRPYLLVRPLHADFAFIRGDVADRWGNVVCRRAARNFNVIMATAARTTIVQVSRLVDLGSLDPELIHIPSPFVDRIVVASS